VRALLARHFEARVNPRQGHSAIVSTHFARNNNSVLYDSDAGLIFFPISIHIPAMSPDRFLVEGRLNEFVRKTAGRAANADSANANPRAAGYHREAQFATG